MQSEMGVRVFGKTGHVYRLKRLCMGRADEISPWLGERSVAWSVFCCGVWAVWGHGWAMAVAAAGGLHWFEGADDDFNLICLQMTSVVRPLVGTADTVLPQEKRFFVVHWFESISGGGGDAAE